MEGRHEEVEMGRRGGEGSGDVGEKGSGWDSEVEALEVEEEEEGGKVWVLGQGNFVISWKNINSHVIASK